MDELATFAGQEVDQQKDRKNDNSCADLVHSYLPLVADVAAILKLVLVKELDADELTVAEKDHGCHWEGNHANVEEHLVVEGIAVSRFSAAVLLQEGRPHREFWRAGREPDSVREVSDGAETQDDDPDESAVDCEFERRKLATAVCFFFLPSRLRRQGYRLNFFKTGLY